MKQISMPLEKRNCETCGAKNTLSYYSEFMGDDMYYCSNCFMITVWDGKKTTPIHDEAYPDRDKKFFTKW